MKNRILALIPARGGSKGLVRKNVKVLNGKPLIYYTIKAALDSKKIDNVYVSSEDREILEISKYYNANIIHRPQELATDCASTESVIFDAIEQLDKQDENFDILLLLQATSPLRDSNDINKALDLFLNNDCTALISVTKNEQCPYKSLRLAGTYLTGIYNNADQFKRRQDFPETFMPNGAIYAIYIDEFTKNKMLFTNKTIPFVMEKDKSYDLDTLNDFGLIEEIMKGNL
ncbi:MAG: acylneuraminate cytidylyltransferase family protein [Saprospiraceae bacterium]|nr:acylneuraminate cytidylyltransferase family protein [Saprospiraceae bacterium]